MTGTSGFAIPYGDLEQLIADLVGASPSLVRSRFRKVRLRPFPDNIQSGTGVRVRYDLRRALALAAAFQLNNLYIPQGHAAAMVETVWPEICRALLIAASECGLVPELDEVPPQAGPIVQIGCSAVAAGLETWLDAACVSEVDLSKLAVRPIIILKTSTFLEAISKWAAERGPQMRGELEQELRELEHDFGWRRPRVEDLLSPPTPIGTSFLYDGPYLTRALDILEAEPIMFDPALCPAALIRLQSLYDYLVHPSPIDAPKRELRFSAATRPLSHYLHFYARDMGLNTHGTIPESWNLEDAKSNALSLVKRALLAKPVDGAVRDAK